VKAEEPAKGVADVKRLKARLEQSPRDLDKGFVRQAEPLADVVEILGATLEVGQRNIDTTRRRLEFGPITDEPVEVMPKVGERGEPLTRGRLLVPLVRPQPGSPVPRELEPEERLDRASCGSTSTGRWAGGTASTSRVGPWPGRGLWSRP
jgi:hypothetical protein